MSDADSPAEDPEFFIPYSSAPFVSGDTFRGLAGRVLREGTVETFSGRPQSVLFSDTENAASRNFIGNTQRQLDTAGTTLVIHNGDTVLSPERQLELEGAFERVFCVNLIEETPQSCALPIGLENLRLRNNGRLSYYFDGLKASRLPTRSRLVVSSFHSSTNPGVREPIEKLFRGSRFGFDGHHWKRREFRDVVMDTCFVISPPGNGPDCHRTWEAIYLGAVPVVLRSALAPSLHDSMPIHVVDSYEELLDLSDDELRDLYLELVGRKPTKAFVDYWISKIFMGAV